jgi:hypothetical protein
MTRDEILNLEAGREMDVTVGYHVMDLVAPPDIYPEYSTDISAAWQVFRNKKVVHWMHDIEIQDAENIQIIGAAEDSYSGATILEGKAPLIICRAALLAVMEK